MGCRGCGHRRLIPAIDLGSQKLSDFRADDTAPPEFPLRVVFCTRCRLAQLDTSVPRELMYHDRYGYRSGVSDTIRADLKSVVADAFHAHGNPTSWLDIACNDGTLLSMVPPCVTRFGVDPVAKFATEASRHGTVVTDFFSASVLPPDWRFDVITAVSMFYDLDDPRGFLADVKSVLAPGGVLVIQQNYLGAMVAQNAIDNIVHEHLTYYTLIALRNTLRGSGLEVFDVKVNGTNGGSFRTFIGHYDDHRIHDRVRHLLEEEDLRNLDSVAPLRALERAGRLAFADVFDFVYGHRDKTFAVYGASTRSATIWQASGIAGYLSCAVERNTEKVGKNYSALGVPIISEQEMRENPPDYLLVGPWFFRDEIVERERGYLMGGGRLVFPLPTLEVVDDRGLLSDERAA